MRSAPNESTLLSVLSASYAWTNAFSTFARAGMVHNTSADEASATDVANPALGVVLQFDITKQVKLAFQSGSTIPVGSGGGNVPTPGAYRAWNNSIDWGGAMFAMNHVDVFNGVRVSYTYRDLTLQLESVLHELLRVRGSDSDPIGSQASVTGTTATASYALFPQLTLTTAFAETRFWNTPVYIEQSPHSRADYFVIGGVSTTVNVGTMQFAPGLLYARALDLPLTDQKFQVVECDLGFAL